MPIAPAALFIIEFLVYSNLWIGAAAAALTFGAFHLLNVPVNADLCALNGVATVLLYSFQSTIKLPHRKHSNRPRLVWMRKYEPLLIGICAVCALSAIALILTLHGAVWALLGVCGAIAVMYSTLPMAPLKPLREWRYVKVFVVAVVWAAIGILSIPLSLNVLPWPRVWSLFAGEFAYITAITIPFDIRDIHVDHPGMRTLPQVFGEHGSRLIALAFLVAHVAFIAPMIHVPAYLILPAVTALFIAKSHPQRHDLYYTFAMDGLMIAQGLMFVIVSR